MTNALKKAWADMVMPILQRPKRVQVAALCYRKTESGKKDVLLITSKDTGRWIVPKGWPIDGLDGPEAALQEAWEEAGVEQADVDPEPVGHYEYLKGMDSGGEAHVDALVYMAQVRSLSSTYPEADERTRRWVDPAEAANMVDEPGLKEILRNL